MAARRASTISIDNSRGKVEQRLRKFRQKVKQIPWLPENLQRPELLPLRRFPTVNLSSSYIEDGSEDATSALFKLPAEIRLKIYEYVIADPGDGQLDFPPLQPESVLHEIKAFPVNCIWRAPGRLIAKPPLRNIFSYNSNRLNLLLTCKTMYAQTIDLFYTLPTFFFCDISVLSDFMSSLLPRRLASIRHLHLQFLLRWPSVLPWWNNPTGRPDNAYTWAKMWTAVSQEMTGLRTLRVYIRQFSWDPLSPSAESERRVLEPLGDIRGLKDFKLWYRHEYVRSLNGDDYEEIYTNIIRGKECETDEAIKFRRELGRKLLSQP